jgi:hypothetical protein
LSSIGCSTFLAQITYSTGNTSRPYAVAIGDVNNDNASDIVAANYMTSNVDVLLNIGNGTFINQNSYSTGTSSYPYGVALADVNSDNKLDIVTGNYFSDTVAVLLNAGNGTFLNLTSYSTGSGSHTYSVAAADLNGDNKPDIVVANFGTNNVGVFLNTGNGTFLNQTTYPTGISPQAVALADVNGDNKSDIIVVNYNSYNVGILLNAGNGTFINQTTYSTGAGSYPFGLAMGDVNSDNKPDVVVANYGTGNVGVMLNAGNGTFSNQSTYFIGTGSDPAAVAVADVNNDNKPDIVAANNYLNTVSVFLNAGNGTFLNQTSYALSVGASPYGVALADVNGDNRPDIIVANYGTNNVGVLFHC